MAPMHFVVHSFRQLSSLVSIGNASVSTSRLRSPSSLLCIGVFLFQLKRYWVCACCSCVSSGNEAYLFALRRLLWMPKLKTVWASVKLFLVAFMIRWWLVCKKSADIFFCKCSYLTRSDEGLTLETSAFQIFHGGNFSFIRNSFDKTKFSLFTLPPPQRHSFLLVSFLVEICLIILCSILLFLIREVGIMAKKKTSHISRIIRFIYPVYYKRRSDMLVICTKLLIRRNQCLMPKE